MGLDRGDVDGGVITIRDGKFGRSRLVSLHASTSAALGSYAGHRDQLCPTARATKFFVSTAGMALQPGSDHAYPPRHTQPHPARRQRKDTATQRAP